MSAMLTAIIKINPAEITPQTSIMTTKIVRSKLAHNNFGFSPSACKSLVSSKAIVDEPYFFSIRLFRSEEHTSELQSRFDLVCRLLLEKKNTEITNSI